MIIVWGTKWTISTLEEDFFICPVCNSNQGYELKQARKYFTFFWIPIFPLGKEHMYIECCSCGSNFHTRLLYEEKSSQPEELINNELIKESDEPSEKEL